MSEDREHAKKHWNTIPCGTGGYLDAYTEGSREYFDAIRDMRYSSESWMNDGIDWNIAKNKRLLEVGHGVGTDLVRFAQAGAIVHGVDISQTHHDMTKQNLACHGLSGELKFSDATNIDFPDEYFDVVYSHGVLHHLEETKDAIEEIRRVLKPGGTFLMSVYHKYSGFHLIGKILMNGIRNKQLLTLGYAGMMSTIESGADGITTRPLVKTFSKGQVRKMLRGFESVDLSVHHFSVSHFSSDLFARLVSPEMEPKLEPWLGWYVVSRAIK